MEKRGKNKQTKKPKKPYTVKMPNVIHLNS